MNLTSDNKNLVRNKEDIDADDLEVENITSRNSSIILEESNKSQNRIESDDADLRNSIIIVAVLIQIKDEPRFGVN